MGIINKYWVLLSIGILFITSLTATAAVNTQTDSEDLNPRRTVLMLSSYLKGDIITRVDTGGNKLVALTFDDGPDPRYTPQVLAILKQYEVKATFFVVGESAKAHPGIIRDAVNGGHEIENHTFTHPELNRGTLAKVTAEIVSTQEELEGMTGRYPHYFRPPKRLYNQAVIKAAHAHDLQVVLWTVGVENRNCPTPQKMAARVLSRARPGAIILAHDGILNREKTVHALPAIITGYQELGYKFVTLSELIAADEQ